MKYYDIHTHTIPSGKDSHHVAIVNYFPSVASLHPVVSEVCFISCGIHPWYLEEEESQWQRLQQIVKGSNVVAVGEAGLDKFSCFSMDQQITIFRKQAFLSEQIGKPLIIHCVKAWDELLHIRKKLNPGNEWIIHGFRGNEIQAKQLLKAGFRLSFGIYFHSAALQAAWPDSVFTETDEEAVSIEDVYKKMALSLAIPLEKIAGQIEKNIVRTFSF